MLDKVEYSDLYKFLTSVGLILIGTSFLLPWLFLRNDLANAFSQEQFNNLINSSQQLIESKNGFQLFVFKALPWVTPVIFFVGLIMTFFGIKNWTNKQNIVDESETLNLTKLKAEVKPLGFTEIKNKADQEIEEELRSVSDAPRETTNEVLSHQDKSDLSVKLINLESQFYSRILEYNTFDYKPEQNVKIAGQFEVDILLNAYNQSKHSDKLIEVKYLQNKLSMNLIRQTYKNLSYLRSRYVHSTGRKNTKVILIVVYRKGIAAHEEFERFKEAFENYEIEINSASTDFYLLNDSEVFEFDIKKLLN